MSIVEAEHPAGVPVSVSVEIGGKGDFVRDRQDGQAGRRAVIVRSGETVVLGTAQGGRRRAKARTSSR
jgi:hypothetical protein